MENLRVVVETENPCARCGAPVLVYERAEDVDELVWVVEYRECSGGCAEFTTAVSPRAASDTKTRSRRRSVA
jgi:hypothetical protein